MNANILQPSKWPLSKQEFDFGIWIICSSFCYCAALYANVSAHDLIWRDGLEFGRDALKALKKTHKQSINILMSLVQLFKQ